MNKIYKSGRNEPISYALSEVAMLGNVTEITRILPRNNGGEFIWEVNTSSSEALWEVNVK